MVPFNSEYQIRIRATKPGFFKDRVAEGVEIVLASSAQEAYDRGIAIIDKGLREKGIARVEMDIQIVDVRKL